jgi:hypothetical protein
MDPTHAIPTLAALSASQKRALILRDHLRYLAPHHLDSFLAGISSPEPPPYRVVKGAVHPPLANVTLQPQAMRFELGNVSFAGGVVMRAALVCVDGRVEMRTEEDGVKLEEDGDGGVPIHVFLAEKMAGLFWDKVEKVRERCAEVNRVRREGWEKARRVQREVREGRVSDGGGADDGWQAQTQMHAQTPAQMQISKRRDPPNNPSVSTTANERLHKRPRTSTPNEPSTGIKQTSTSAPTSITAPPRRTSTSVDASYASSALTNLLSASRNLISVYSDPSSEFADLHAAVVKLKDAVDGTPSLAEPLASGSGVRQPAAKARDADADGDDADAYASSIARTNRQSATEAQARGKRADRPAPPSSDTLLSSATGSFCEVPEIARQAE